ncbi:hypothetical protein [Halomonas mongoliensis]|uniref:hypothetical protein n=1 Tax=Halomonas mongoliensis TaxID=321265 RepID=UPI00403B25CD
MSQLSDAKHVTQWQLGEWPALHCNEAALLLQVAARIEQGDLSATTEAAFTQAERQEKLKLLRSAIHNSLGRSALLLNRTEKAKQHFHNALQHGLFPGDPDILAPLRMAHQASQLGLNPNHLTDLHLHLSHQSQYRQPQSDLVKRLHDFNDRLLSQLAEQEESMVLDAMPVFNGKDPFMAGKVVMALAQWVTEYQPGDPITHQRIQRARSIIVLLEKEKTTSWGIFFYLKGIRQLQSAGLLDACFSVNHLLRMKDELHWNGFVDPQSFKLKNKPANFYQVGYAIAQLRFQLGWEDAEPSYKMLDALQEHYDVVSGEFGFADETQGKGRYDRYSFLLVAEIAQRMREAGLTLPENLKKNLRRSADYVLINLNEKGDGFQYGRSIGAYGDTAFIEILTAAAWYDLLSPEEMQAAHYFSCLCTQKFIDYWWDEARGSVNLWEDGRVTDGYRGKHRILGENFSLIYQHLYTQNVWSQLGFTQPKLSQDDYRHWLNQLPKATLTWFHKGQEGDSQQAVFTYRDGGRIFNLPLVNGVEYATQSTYLPIPYTSLDIQGLPDTSLPLLVPKIQLQGGGQIWPVDSFSDVSFQQDAEGGVVSWAQQLNDDLFLSTQCHFKPGVIERHDTLSGRISDIESLIVQWPETIAVSDGIHPASDMKSGSAIKLEFYGYQLLSGERVARCQPDFQDSLGQLKSGWALSY